MNVTACPTSSDVTDTVRPDTDNAEETSRTRVGDVTVYPFESVIVTDTA